MNYQPTLTPPKFAMTLLDTSAVRSLSYIERPPAMLPDSSSEPPLAKKARCIPSKSWKLFTSNSGPEGNLFGLRDLFAGSGFDSNGDVSAVPPAAAAATNHQQANKFYTLRLEHRQGGPLAQFRGEERLLLFRSDAKGAIAKIIYSSEPPEGSDSSKQPPPLQEGESIAAHTYLIAHAKVHVLDVKSQYRGRDLGGLLFSEAMSSLKSKYVSKYPYSLLLALIFALL